MSSSRMGKSEMTPQNPEGEAGPELPSYSNLSPFVRLLKNRGRVKMLDALLRRPASEVSSEELANLAGVSKATVSRNRGVLLEMGIISVREDNNRALYSLNEENEVVQVLADFHSELLSYYQDIMSSKESYDEHLKTILEAINERQEEQEEEPAGEDEVIKAALAR